MKPDLVKTDRDYYQAGAKPELREFGTHGYAAITGQGEPDGEAFGAAVAALYPVAFAVKKLTSDFVVPKLEGLWWVDGDRHGLDVPRAEWRWTLLLRMPEFVPAEAVAAAGAARGVGYEELTEGPAVQVLHVGPYATEPETLALLDGYLTAHGLTRRGHHHEIYLTDARRTPPARMRTILRQPVTG